MKRTWLVAGLLAGPDTAAIGWLNPAWGRLGDRLAAPYEWVRQVGPDRVLATLAAAGLWCAAVWVGAGLLAACAAQLPGAVGRASGAVSRVLLPAAVRRLIAGSAGLGVLLAPVAAGAHPAPGTPEPHPGVATSVPAPGWPSEPTVPAPGSLAPHPGVATSVPAPAWPSEPTVPAPRWPSEAIPADHPARPDPRSHVAAAGRAVLVRPGDSLWLIAARRLGADPSPGRIAAAWPGWYAANRTTIGADPALIIPGQVLRAPSLNTGSNSQEAPT